MLERKIIVEPFCFINYFHVDIKICTGQHATAYVEGNISSDTYDGSVSTYKKDAKIRIIAVNGDQEEILFSGVAQKLIVNEMNGIKTLRLWLISHTVKMDITPERRTFQDRKMSYKRVVDIVNYESGDQYGVLIPQRGGDGIRTMFVQYDETDWSFYARVASRLNRYLIPDYKLDVPYVSLGKPHGRRTIALEAQEYSEVVDFEEMNRNKKAGLSQNDCTYYEFRSREIYSLCDCISLVGKGSLYIWSISTELEGAHLVHTYALKPESGFRRQEYYNTKLIGIELSGVIFEIKKELVKVIVQGDVHDENRTFRWFPYATAYSSPKNVGWYFMPENGDSIRLCFPTQSESDVYVASAVHVGERENPDIKSIRTIYGKAVVFAPDYIKITNGSSTITMDEKGVEVYSDVNINLRALSDVILDGKGKVEIFANEHILAQQGESKILVKENIDILSDHVRLH